MHRQDSANVATTSLTLNPVFEPIKVNIRGGTVTFYIREGCQPSEQMIKVMKNHRAPIPLPTM
jgi:hypothetical protein